MKSYLQDQDLWDIVGGTEVNPPEDIVALKKWNVKEENMLTNQEALAKQMSEITIKSNNEEALFSGQRKGASKNNRLHDHRKKGECYKCGKISHYARECHRKKKTTKSNAVTSEGQSISEEWDAEACCTTIDPKPRPTSNAMENEVLALHVEEVDYEYD
ncbi:Zinc finger, CCHC-type [Cucumis melo var. makuwa]|uniref:Zinc finger, CCHC-type n=1 Tax=Cucumis melo var. makuwa TaxID=1194695 RepID=A0A5D3BRZ9_CUCMM|nr:Zinc finger, CCHC-type [Cucumis melo var. makuwa]